MERRQILSKERYVCREDQRKVTSKKCREALSPQMWWRWIFGIY
jgi:hypothetical protein